MPVSEKWPGKTASSQRSMSEEDRRPCCRATRLDPHKLSAADEKFNRALADAVERHAAKDPGVRGILKMASATCHPESESQKKSALGHRAGIDATPLGLAWRIVRIRHATQHHHKDCTGHRHE